MNIKKYLNRLGITKTQVSSLEFLKTLQKAHLFKIPFENLDIHYGRKIILDEIHLFSKIIENMRGGFCYELNSLFYKLLTQLGFNVKIISAKVFNKETGYGNEFDHMALIATINNVEYLTDVGFGDFCFGPLKLELNTSQKDEAGEFFFDLYDLNTFRINKIKNGEKTPQYIFEIVNRELDDFNEMCLYHQTSDESPFTKQKVITLPTPKGRVTLNGNKIKIVENGVSQSTFINSEIEFKKYLWEYFKIKEI